MRLEKDSMGAVNVPKNALYGAHTQRAVENFVFSDWVMPKEFICALGMIKQAAAQVNTDLNLLDKKVGHAIVEAASNIAQGQHQDQFPVDVFQTGSATSTHMNVNEVIATLASDVIGRPVDALDEVNLGQSSNDVIPTAIHLSALLMLENHLEPVLEHLANTIDSKAQSLKDVVKTGRTHLMDAMPVTMAQELSGWSAQVRHSMDRLSDVKLRLRRLPQGGTAVGTGINAHPQFSTAFAEALSKITALDLQKADNFFALLSAPDAASELSAGLRAVAAVLLKIANDLRWMNSGPTAGLGEITLQPLQPGSSIMPGKINPIIPEAVAMLATQIFGLDTTIALACQSGNFQLNVMLPVIAFNLLNSLRLSINGSRLLADKAIATFEVNRAQIAHKLKYEPVFITALTPKIGYMKAAEIAKEVMQTGQTLLEVASKRTSIPHDTLKEILNPEKLTQGGIIK